MLSLVYILVVGIFSRRLHISCRWHIFSSLSPIRVVSSGAFSEYRSLLGGFDHITSVYVVDDKPNVIGITVKEIDCIVVDPLPIDVVIEILLKVSRVICEKIF
jgi:hypothetical protein